MPIRPTCPVCGNEVEFISLQRGFKCTCSLKCSNEMRNQKIKQTCLEKYGVENPQQVKEISERTRNTFKQTYVENCKEIQEKSRQTRFERYGDENFRNVEKAKETKLKLYGNCNNIQKTMATLQKRFGVSNVFQLDSVKEKSRETKERKYNNPTFTNPEKRKQTINSKYGTDTFTQSKQYKDNLQQYREKYSDTLFEHYGERQSCWFKTHDHKNRLPEIIDKITESKRKHNTFNTSTIEKKIIERLTESGIDFHYQYKSSDYPWRCDFWIDKANLYVEIQGHWTHGPHPFNEQSLEDIDIVKKWKSQNSEFYDVAINSWTKRDVKKRNRAKERNLNYLEIFSCDVDECMSIIMSTIEELNC
jgi:hypothetical protein